jgi:hypothetical protein
MPNTTRPAFQTDREAKEFLISRILTEANREGIEIGEIERKMLYFSETGWTLPGILDVNSEFECDYDNEEYETKIAGIIRQIEKTNTKAAGDEQALWEDAIVKLSEGDHYLLVLIRLGQSAPARGSAKWLPSFSFYEMGKIRPAGDFFRLIVIALASILAMAGVAATLSWLRR